MLNIQAFKEKKKIIYLMVSLVIFVLLVLGLFILNRKESKEPESPSEKEKTAEEILQDLTAPTSTEANEVPTEVIENLSAPEKEKPVEVPEKVIEGLTAPENK